MGTLFNFGVADGARTHDNRNHNPDFSIFRRIDLDRKIHINQCIKQIALVKIPVMALIEIRQNSQ
jgi:hypothetical protein